MQVDILKIYTIILTVILFAFQAGACELKDLSAIKDLNDLPIAKEVSALRGSTVNKMQLTNEQVNLERYVYYSTKQINNEFSPFKTFEGKNLKSVRQTGQTTWWYLKLSAQQLAPEQKYFLQVGNSKVSEIYIYYLKGDAIDTIHTAGLNFNRSTTFLSSNLLVNIGANESIEILIEMPPRYTMLDMNMNVNLSSNNFPLAIVPVQHKIEKSLKEYFSYGVFCGYFLLYLFVVSQLVSNFVGSQRFLFMLFTISGGLALLALTGVGFKFIWIDAIYFEHISVSLLSNLFILGSFMFFIRVAPMLWQIKWVRPIYYLCCTIVMVNIIGTFVTQYVPVKWHWYFHDFRSLGFIFCNIMFVLGMSIYWLKVKDKRVLPIIAVYFLLVISLSISILNSLQIVSSFNTYQYMYVLILIFAAALTWYLLYRIDILNYRILLKNENRMKAIEVGVNLERKRWSNELHDSIGGVISLATLKLSNLESQLGSKEKTAELQAIRMDLTKAWKEVNSISKNILPENLAQLGLVEALKQYVQNLNGRAPVEIETYFKSEQFFKNENLMLHIYRIVQELLTNSLKHARASQIKLQVYEFNQQLNISVEDNGIGFDIKAIENNEKQTGLSNLRKRIKLTGGYIEIESNPKRGSFVHFRFPIKVLKEPYSVGA